MPRVSILIPTLARPARRRECGEAAVASTYEDIEVVVGDDGELGRAVCDAIDDPRLRYVANPRRLGIAGNWNALLDGARGELLALCMDDDRLAPGFVEACVDIFDRAPDLAVVFTAFALVDDAGNERVWTTRMPPGRHDSFAREFMIHPALAVSAAMFTRSAWAAVRPLPGTAAADMVLFGRLAERGLPFCYVDTALMRYRTHADQYSGTPAFRDDVVDAWRQLRFSDAVAERRRRRVLSDALAARARLRVRERRSDEARADLRAAIAIGGPRARRHALLHPVTFAPPTVIRAGYGLWRRLRTRA
ncbi:MAG: glycosyltransferase family 2 protein [Solirubrobacteraceae bacterium]